MSTIKETLSCLATSAITLLQPSIWILTPAKLMKSELIYMLPVCHEQSEANAL